MTLTNDSDASPSASQPSTHFASNITSNQDTDGEPMRVRVLKAQYAARARERYAAVPYTIPRRPVDSPSRLEGRSQLAGCVPGGTGRFQDSELPDGGLESRFRENNHEHEVPPSLRETPSMPPSPEQGCFDSFSQPQLSHDITHTIRPIIPTPIPNHMSSGSPMWLHTTSHLSVDSMTQSAPDYHTPSSAEISRAETPTEETQQQLAQAALKTGSSSAFANASNFTIGTANFSFFEINQALRDFQNRVLNVLKNAGVTSAMLDSAERSDPPRCIPGTRQSTRNRILDWARGTEHNQNVFWLFGPVGVGKSAIAQTVAEELRSFGLLGAAFFFSRPERRENPNVLIPTIAYQLATCHTGYKRLITQRLVDDPAILTKNRTAQLKELILEPFDSVVSQEPDVKLRLIIVIDGLDECSDRIAQHELITALVGHPQRVNGNSPLLWMICSRSESHLKNLFASDECQVHCRFEELEIENREAREDGARILEAGFARMRKQYGDELPPKWPSKGDTKRIGDAGAGHLGFISFILRYIADEHFSNPIGQLKICLRFLDGLDISGGPHPLRALDLLYTQILSTIPKADLDAAMLILGLTILHGSEHLTVLTQANFLGLDQATFYRSLRNLHSVIFVPPAADAHAKSLRVYHSSFSEYLRDDCRSGEFSLDEGAVHLEVAMRGIWWLSNPSQPMLGFTSEASQETSWLPVDMISGKIFGGLRLFAASSCWRACPQVDNDSLGPLMNVLESFDFHLDRLQMPKPSPKDFAYFIRWLYSLDDNNCTLITVKDQPVPYDTLAEQIYISDDPEEFLKPFSQAPDRFENRSVYIQLGKTNPAAFNLNVAFGYEPMFGRR